MVFYILSDLDILMRFQPFEASRYLHLPDIVNRRRRIGDDPPLANGLPRPIT